MSNAANETPTPPESIVGKTIAGYKVVQRIQKTLVFLAFKENPENQVAVKVFYPDPYAQNREAILERLRAVCVLDHSNVVKAYEVGEKDDFIYVIMEYSPGENLYELLQRNPRLHWAAAAEIAREITKGLVAAHAQDVYHLSLHPDRILLGKGGQIKINFCNEGVITPSSEVVHFVSPELFLGQTLDKRSDIYSLGAIIYSIVTGNTPLSGKSPREIALKHRQLAPMLPSYGVADIPHGLSLIIERTMSKEIEQRYSNAFELLAALNNLLLNDTGGIHCFKKGLPKIKENLIVEPGYYKLGAYKELLPKIVSSEHDKSFTQAISLEYDRQKKEKQEPPSQQQPKPSLEEFEKKYSSEGFGQTSRIYRESIHSRLSHLSEARLGRHHLLVIFLCVFSLVSSFIIMLQLL